MQASPPRSAHALALARVPDPQVARGRSLLLAAGLVLGLAPAPLAQQFQQRGIKGYLPVRANPTRAVVLGDVDGDGDLDLVEGGRFGMQNTLLTNDGVGRFADASEGRITGVQGRQMRLGDVDGDHDLDLVWASRAQLFLHRNDGTGVFEDVTASHLPALTSATPDWYPELGDVDADGDLDIAVGSQWLLLLNDGSGHFTDVTASHLPPAPGETRWVAFADVEGDGDLDLLVEAKLDNDPERLYLNDGTGAFTDATAVRMPPIASEGAGFTAGDVDGDGDVDAVLLSFAERHRLYVNDGTGTFAEASSQMPSNATYGTAAALADLDRDGDLDLVIANGGGFIQSNSLHLNDGSGSFTGGGGLLPPDTDDSSSLAVGDVDADGDLDLVFGNVNSEGEQDRLFLNDGAASFVNASRDRVPHASSRAPAVRIAADVDGDGDLDVLVARGQEGRNCGFTPCGEPVEQLVNDGQGILSDLSDERMPQVATNCTALAAGDLDGDGDPDLVVGSSYLILFCYHYTGTYYLPCDDPQPVTLLLNDGQGTYSSAGVLAPGAPELRSARAVVLGDVDLDGDLDVLAGGQSEQTRLYRNEGGGVFQDVTAAKMPDRRDLTEALALLDVDGDGDPDLVIGTTSGLDALLLNDGTGRFTVGAAGLPPRMDDTRAIASGDLDGDGDPDLVFGHDELVRFCRNDGTGLFEDAGEFTPLASGEVTSLALSDVEEDEDLDVWIGTTEGSSLLLVNDGTGTFTDETGTRTHQEAGRTDALVAGDFDGDGDVDLYEGHPEGDQILTNLHRQLGAPLFPLVGRDYEVVLDVEPGYATTAHAAVAAIGTQLLPSPTTVPPLVGGLRLLPPVTLLPAALVPAAAGSVTLTQPIPPDPGLLGTLFYLQGVILGGDQHLHLTGYVQERIRF